MMKRLLAIALSVTTLVTLIVIGGSEAARADGDPRPMPIEMGRWYVRDAQPNASGWHLRPAPTNAIRPVAAQAPQIGPPSTLPEIRVTRVPVTPIPTANATPTTALSLTVTPEISLTEAEVASLTALNDLRAGLGLSQLRPTADLTDFAKAWAVEMSQTTFQHSSSEDSRRLLVDGRTSFGENIVWHSNDDLTPAQAAAEFHRLWVDSPGHYRNMTNAAWTEVGVGLHRDAGGWWGVHTFGNN